MLAKARLIFVSYPNNPTGAVIEDDFFAAAGRLRRARTTSSWSTTTPTPTSRYDGYVAPSFLETPGAKDVGVEMSQPLQELQHDRLARRRRGRQHDVVDAYWRLKTNMDSGMFGAVQRAGVAALSGAQDCVREMCRVYQRRRDLLVDGRCARLGLHVAPPKGTIYLWAPCPSGTPPRASPKLMLEQADVVVTPGAAYGARGEGYVRLSLTVPDERMREAVRRIEERVRF